MPQHNKQQTKIISLFQYNHRLFFFQNHVLIYHFQKLNKVLYGSKLVEFKANTAKLDVDYLGSLVINESINYNILKKFNIDDQLNDFADNIFFVTNPNGSFFIAYQNESNKLIIVTNFTLRNKI